jgi:hypothetical protein
MVSELDCACQKPVANGAKKSFNILYNDTDTTAITSPKRSHLPLHSAKGHPFLYLSCSFGESPSLLLYHTISLQFYPLVIIISSGTSQMYHHLSSQVVSPMILLKHHTNTQTKAITSKVSSSQNLTSRILSSTLSHSR